MNREGKNKNFDLNAKYKDMIQTATKIVEYNLNKNDNSEPKSEICLAYDVKNYLPQLLSQIDQQEQIIREAREKLSFIDDYIENDLLTTMLCITKISKTLEILDRNVK